MTSVNHTRLTSAQRLSRGLAHTAAGPVDVVRGATGLGAHSVAVAFGALRQRYQEGKLRKEVAAAQDALREEFAAAQEVLANLPDSYQEARSRRRGNRRIPRPWLLIGAGAAVLAAGGAAFAIVRRSRQPEPSALPPSVQIDPAP